MEKQYRLREGEYDSKEKAIVEIIELVEPKVFAVTEANIIKTIEHLEAKKLQLIQEIDAEIAVNQENLLGVREAAKNVPTKVVEENISK